MTPPFRRRSSRNCRRSCAPTICSCRRRAESAPLARLVESAPLARRAESAPLARRVRIAKLRKQTFGAGSKIRWWRRRRRMTPLPRRMRPRSRVGRQLRRRRPHRARRNAAAAASRRTRHASGVISIPETPVPPHRRAHGPGARPRPADPAQHGGARPVGLPPRVRVRRSRSALTPERPERRPRRGDEGAAPADRGDRGRRHDQPDPARPSRQHGFAMRLPGNGRHAHPRARPIPKGHWPRKGREAGTRPGPCPRSATPVRRRAARLRLPLLPGSTANGTCVATSREVGRPSAG